MSYDIESMPFINSGESEVVSSGTVISHRGKYISLYIPKIRTTLFFSPKKAENEPEPFIKVSSNEEGREIYIDFINAKPSKFLGTFEPITLGHSVLNDGGNNAFRYRLELSAYMQFLSEDDEFTLTYTVYATKIPADSDEIE